MNAKTYCCWEDVPTEVLVNAINVVFDPTIDETATKKDDRESMISALTEKGVTLKDIEELEELG